jgi:hypothetical protein
MSKISIATGISKQDIENIVDNSSKLPPPKPTIQAALSEILHLWHTDSGYLGPYGVPLEVEFESTRGRSFSELVRNVDSTAEPYVLLDELLKSGAVVKSGEMHLKVLSRTFLVPEPMSPVMLEYFGNTVTSLTNTLEFNMDPANFPKRLQRSVYADRGLTASQILEFEHYSAAKAQEFMIDLDNWLADLNARAEVADGPLIDIGISVFEYVRPKEKERQLDKLIDSRLA